MRRCVYLPVRRTCVYVRVRACTRVQAASGPDPGEVRGDVARLRGRLPPLSARTAPRRGQTDAGGAEAAL